MNEQTKQDVLESSKARADFYRFMASIFLYELNDKQIETFATTALPCDDSKIGQGYAVIAEYLRHRDTGTRQEMAVDYARVFLGAGNYDKLVAPPYESVYTSRERLLMQDARDGALTFYRAEGLDLPADNTTPEDHIGFEMQFMATVIERAAQALDDGDEARFSGLALTQKAFFDEHLANWLPAFASDIQKNAQTGFYKGVALLTRGLLEAECGIVCELASLAVKTAGVLA